MHPMLGWYPPILAYHRVSPEHSSATPTLRPETFERQMRLLAQRWRPIPMDRLAEALEKGEPPPRRGVVVTFDDGTEDHYTHAFPILTRHRIPAVVFLIAGNIGKPGFLSWPQIREMRAGGITFGSHTLAHDYLPSLPGPQAEESLTLSRQLLKEQGIPADHLSYPAGGFTEEIARIAGRVGYRTACTTNRGFRRFPADRWALRRITMHESTRSSLGLWLRCCGWYGLNRSLRKPA